MAKQKFRRYQFVQVASRPNDHVSVYGNFPGIICGSYSDKFGGKRVNIYSVYELGVTKDGVDKVVDRRSWYDESQISPTQAQDTCLAADLIEEYNLG
jgi:hypothetical protein